MKKKIFYKIRDVIEVIYFITFFISMFAITGNIDANEPVPTGFIIAYIISAIMVFCKIYFTLYYKKGENNNV